MGVVRTGEVYKKLIVDSGEEETLYAFFNEHIYDADSIQEKDWMVSRSSAYFEIEGVKPLDKFAGGEESDVELWIEIYYNEPATNAGELLQLGNGLSISKYSMILETRYDEWREVFPQTRIHPAEHDRRQEKFYYKLDNTEYLNFRKKYMGESMTKKITTKNIYEVVTNDTKYLLVESDNGFYKTTNAHDMSKYKKVDDVKAKKFIDNPANIWKGIKVVDLMTPPIIVEYGERPDVKLKNAIEQFRLKTGIPLEKMHATNDKVYFHGMDANNEFNVEIQLLHKNGNYELHEMGTEITDTNNRSDNKRKIQKIQSLIHNVFGNL